MHFDKDYEREISLRDLFFHVLYKWRSILVVALIGAILLSGYTFISNLIRTSGKTAAAIVENSVSATEESTSETGDVGERLYKLLVDETAEYCNQSVLMQLNPYAVWKAIAIYSVIPEEKGSAGMVGGTSLEAELAAAYPSMAFESLDTDRLGKIYGDVGPGYVKELVNAVYIDGSGAFSVEVMGLTEEMAAKGLEYFDEAVRKVSQGNIQQSGRHSVVTVSQHIAQSSSLTVQNRQNDVLKNYTSYVKAAYPDGRPTDSETASSAKSVKAKKPKIHLFALIGFIAGAFFMVCLYGVLYLLSRKLRNARELTDQFSVPVYGQLNHTRARRPGRCPDSLIEKWEFRKTKTDRDAVLENTCALIREHGGKGGILLTGTLSTERMQALADSIKERLGDAMPVAVEGSFLKNPRVIAEATEASAVIVAEEQYVSDLDEVCRMLELLRIGNTPVSGAIVI